MIEWGYQMNNTVDTLIIGAGITGLSLASFLGTDDYLIVEKDSEVGGYCKTTIRNGFVWDYSGHFFHFNNQEIKDYVLENIECDIKTVRKKSHISYKDMYIDFPFQNNIHQLPTNEFIECLYDLYHRGNEKVNTFTDYVVNTLGHSICDKFIIPYNEKLYACDLNKLDYDAMGRFFPKPTMFEDLLSELRNNNKTKSYNDTFIYPTGGSIEFVKSLYKRVNEKNVLLNTKIIGIDLENKIAQTNNGYIKFNKLVNTMPFDTFMKLTGEKVDNLSSNKVVVFNLGFDKPTDINSNWVYYPNDEIFYRVGFYNNIFGTDKMSLYVEIGMDKTQEVNEKDLLNKILDDLSGVGVVTNHTLVDHQMIIMNPAYVHITKESKEIYNDWCKKNNPNGLFSIGRYGSWTYCSIEDNIIQAKELSIRLV
jgi:protoporphyrinogen oxidase